jgi:hypothetical protein
MTIEVKDIKAGERVKRGTVPPYIALDEAFRLANTIYAQGGGRASTDMMSRFLGNSSSSSSFNKKIGALRLYGVLSEQGGVYTLTEVGNAVAAPVSEDYGITARRAVFLNVPQYSKLFERLKSKLLPADEFLKNILEQDVGVPRDFSVAWVKAFKDALKATGLLFVRADGKSQILEFPLTDSERPTAKSETSEVVSAMEPPPQIPESPTRTIGAVIPSQVIPVSASGNNTRFELSDGQVAEFCIPFGINSKDARRLKNFLKGLEFFIDSAVIDDPGESK